MLEHAIQQSSVLGGATEKKSQEELEAVVAAATGITAGSSGKGKERECGEASDGS